MHIPTQLYLHVYLALFTAQYSCDRCFMLNCLSGNLTYLYKPFVKLSPTIPCMTEKDRCKDCMGKKTKREKKILEVRNVHGYWISCVTVWLYCVTHSD